MDMARILRKRRFENGALRLSSPEVRFETDQVSRLILLLYCVTYVL